MKRILVLATDYSNNEGKIVLHYIHTRNLEYMNQGLSVTVLNFSAIEDYVFEGVKVVTPGTFSEEGPYDVLVSHAPNLRQHYKFIKKNKTKFNKTILFFHGHEVLRLSEAYPTPYAFMGESKKIKRILRDVYDSFKFKVWKNFILNNPDIHLVFVSNWMYDEFSKSLKLDKKLENVNIIYNSVGDLFEKEIYTPKNVEFDFITIRNQIDFSKYCVDVVLEVAKEFKDKTFLVVGKGEFFKHHPNPDNLIHLNKHLSHKEVIEYLNKSRIALLPTRTDAQGVMACEMTAFGIPLVTSKIKVTEEVFDKVDNVAFIDNDEIDYETLVKDLNLIEEKGIKKSDKFYKDNTIIKEINLIMED